MKVKHKLIAILFILVSLMGLIGYLGALASKYVAKSYEGKDEHFRSIVLAATELSGQVKTLESKLVLHLTLDAPFDKEQLSEGYVSLQNRVQEIKEKLTSPREKEFIYKMEFELENILQTGMSLIEEYNNDLASTGKFNTKQYGEQLRKFHDGSSSIRKIGIMLADENTLFLNRQKPITIAAETGSYAKRAEGHLMLYLALNEPADKEKFFKRHASLRERITTLRRLTNHPAAGDIIDKMEFEARKILQAGKTLLEAHDSGNRVHGDFQIQQYRGPVLDLSSATSLVQKYSNEVMLHNFDWETNKTKLAREQAASIQKNIIALVIACIFIASLLGYGLYRSITRSIEKLKAMSISIGKGNLDAQSKIETNDEFAELGISFNKMCKALKSSRDELLAAKESSESANRAKSDFLSRMSHELRTPLNAIVGFAQILELDELGARERESVGHIHKAGRHLTDLINEVLDIARIESGHQNLSPEPVHIYSVLEDTWNLMRPLAAERNIQLKGNIPKDCNVSVFADLQRLKQVILNLLSNAVKYNHDGGTVQLSCAATNDKIIRISVSDTGPGIAAESHERVFEAFERLNADESEVEGSGVGLALSKALIVAMGGKLGLDSELGVGSTFWIELPLIDGVAEQHHDGKENQGLATTTDEEQVKPVTLLYIEDNIANLRLVEVALSRKPHIELIAAMQGKMGIDLAFQHKPALILLDLHLPDLMGDEVLARLKSHPETQQIPVVIISADATKRQIEKLLSAGAYAYLTKPFNIKELLSTIDAVIESESGSCSRG
ncbi:ATP-binding protein [Sulfuriflexus mobilis]|uniref:ATP-binding protein n=1 Tax=Sulfuriflexus mobilis TaxID=1811807 RepID=UPI000F849748|nr:ATP-binding protein [Sulfuriflexus mobilis]